MSSSSPRIGEREREREDRARSGREVVYFYKSTKRRRRRRRQTLQNYYIVVLDVRASCARRRRCRAVRRTLKIQPCQGQAQTHARRRFCVSARARATRGVLCFPPRRGNFFFLIFFSNAHKRMCNTKYHERARTLPYHTVVHICRRVGRTNGRFFFLRTHTITTRNFVSFSRPSRGARLHTYDGGGEVLFTTTDDQWLCHSRYLKRPGGTCKFLHSTV